MAMYRQKHGGPTSRIDKEDVYCVAMKGGVDSISGMHFCCPWSWDLDFKAQALGHLAGGNHGSLGSRI